MPPVKDNSGKAGEARGRLQLAAGVCSRAGIKPQNEDSAVFHWPPDSHLQEYLGAVAAVADGVSSAEAGARASHMATGQFVDDYYSAPETWSAARAGRQALSAINSKLYRKSHDYLREEKGFLCTFSAVVFKSRTAHYFHVGDSRVYLWRSGKLECVTRDHSIALGHRQSMLSRALGMDTSLSVDHGRVAAKRGDRFLLTSDGVHDFLPRDALAGVLRRNDLEENEIAEALVRLAEEAGSDDNLTALVVSIRDIPDTTLEEYSHKIARLPFPPPLAPGMILDDYAVEREVFSSQRSQIYLVRDTRTGKALAMKTPSVNYRDDIYYIDRFVREEWVGLRIHSDRVVRVLRQNRPRTALYYLMEHIEGCTLETWMERNRFPQPAEAFRIVRQIAEGLQAFHERETIHRDLKPANIMIDGKGQVKIVDFGSVYVAGSAEIFRPLEQPPALGTASYSDPHTLMGRNTAIRGDIYALATIVYEMFTGELPYGEGIDACRSMADYEQLQYRSARLFNPILPVWFDRALERGCAVDLDYRYHSIERLLTDLRHPNPDYLRDDPEEHRNQNTWLFWKLLCGLWIATLLSVFALFYSAR